MKTGAEKPPSERLQKPPFLARGHVSPFTFRDKESSVGQRGYEVKLDVALPIPSGSWKSLATELLPHPSHMLM